MSEERLIQWSNSLELGLTIVDAEHQILIDLINDLHEINELQKKDALRSKDEKLKMALRGLLDYTNTHFVVEEEFMRIYQYPQILEHRAAHQSFANRVSGLMNTMEVGGLDIPQSLMNFLKNWLTTHILKIDKQLVEFLISKGVH